MPHAATDFHWWIPRGDDPYDEEDFVKALYRFCKEEATEQDLWFIHAAIARVYGDPDVSRFFDVMLYVAEEHTVRRRDGTVEKRQRYSDSTSRSTKFRLQSRLSRFLSEQYRI